MNPVENILARRIFRQNRRQIGREMGGFEGRLSPGFIDRSNVYQLATQELYDREVGSLAEKREILSKYGLSVAQYNSWLRKQGY